MSFIKVSVPGRTEVAGNHEDYQGGCVIAAAVDRRMTCIAELQEDNLITVESEGFAPFSLDLDSSDFDEPHISEHNTTRSIVRGMASQLKGAGFTIPGCRLSFTSDIPVGMGLSSSAAFELCCGTALYELSKQIDAHAQQLESLELARMAVRTEREFFGKPSGFMDQAICELGGMKYFDFADPDNPFIEPVELPASWSDYTCLLIECESGHEDATDDYAQVALDMQEVARCLKVKQLRDLDFDDYLNRFNSLRAIVGDRAALRGYHFYKELDSVKKRLAALKTNNLEEFVSLSDISGVSSAEYLHNVSMPNTSQPAMIALAFCRMALEDASYELQKTNEREVRCGSARIHGGGFGGTIQVFLPRDQVQIFTKRIKELLGEDRCVPIELGGPGILVEVDE